MFKSQIKHKAMHCGYKKKPTKGQVNGLLNLYMGCHQAIQEMKPKTEKKGLKEGTQLKLF